MIENIEAVEKRLWTAADQLRANSDFASNEYFMPVMGLIFLRHAYSRYLAVKPEIEASLPSRGGVKPALTKQDFTSRGAIFLRREAQFDHLVSLPDGADRAQSIINAMEAVEDDYAALKGVLPKTEYQSLENDVLGNVLRIFNDPALQDAKGDVFGRIYEYFLTQFADQSAHDGGEFFTPPSIVQMIVNAIEPDHGKVLDPACGSGGMFVQSAHFIERMKQDPTKVATFYGQEKNATTIRLAKMNLAVHGLEGKIEPGITYYTDAHELIGGADFVMANPPFNVDEVDAERIRKDSRLPFGLPGVNKGKKVSNGNYLWISYFYSYLTQNGLLSLNMRNALPHASFLGFTGTPLMSGDEVTKQTFGDYISTYDFQRAVEDEATVPLYYDARGEKLGIATNELNEEIAAKLDELELDDPSVTERLEKELKREYHIITAETRLDKIAADFVQHYTTGWETGKAMLVCIDKVTCNEQETRMRAAADNARPSSEALLVRLLRVELQQLLKGAGQGDGGCALSHPHPGSAPRQRQVVAMRLDRRDGV